MKQMNIQFQADAQHDDNTHSGHVWKLYVDGASRNNPGPSGAGVHIVKDARTIEKIGFFLGVKTNNEAEYLALLIGVFILKQYVAKADQVYIISDSQLLVKQLLGQYRVKTDTLRPFFNLAFAMVKDMNAQMVHVLRAENSVADKMANWGITHKVALPADFLTLLSHHALFL